MKKFLSLLFLISFLISSTSFVLKASALTPSYTPSTAYTNSKYYTALCNVQLTGNQATDLVNVALSQVGYHEGNNISELNGANTYGSGQYSEAGYWFGLNVKNLTYGWYADWCAMFVSWCARQAEISTSIISNSAYAAAKNQDYCFKNLTYTPRSSATPKIGDLIFFDYASAAGQWDHVGIVYKVDSSYVYTVEGNANKAVTKYCYNLNTSYIQGYGRPNYSETTPVTTYTVTYDVNGGESSILEQKKSHGETMKINTTIPTKNGCVFMGWSEIKGSKQIDYIPGGIFIKNTNTTLYAVWNDAISWSEWSEWSTTEAIPTFDKQVEIKNVYQYYHNILMYEGGNCGAYPINATTFNTYLPNYPVTQHDYHKDIYSDMPLEKVDRLIYDKEYDCYENICCPTDYNYDNGENASYVYYLGSTTMYRYRDAIAEGEDSSPISDFKYSVDSTTKEVTITGYTGSEQFIKLPSKIDGNPVTKIGNQAFMNKTGLVLIEIPDSVIYIGNKSFEGCSNLIEMTIPDSVISIGEYAFKSCVNLSSVKLSKNINKINNYTFNYCSALTDIEIPNGVTSIGSAAFCGCDGLTSIIIPNSVKTIEKSAFDTCKNLASVTLGSGLTTIGTYGFNCCYALSNINIPSNVTTIGEYAFSYCRGLSTVTIEKGLKTVGNSAFTGCTGLTSINIPNSVMQIGNHAFESCTGLQSISIPESIVTFGSYSFKSCTGLSVVEIKDGVKNIGNGAFKGCTAITEIIIPGSISMLSNEAFYECKNLKKVVIKDGVKTIGADSFRSCSAFNSVSIPESVTTINGYAFGYCTSLERITLPSKITFLNSGLFSGCTSLKSITIPSNVTQIYNNAFSGCKNLSEVNFSVNITTIGSEAFTGCSALTNIVLPEKLTTINDWVFKDSGLIDITIPKSVTTISPTSFIYCTKLTTVRFMGTTLSGIETFNSKSNYCPNLKTVYVYRDSSADKYFSAEDYTKIYLDEEIVVESVSIDRTSATLKIGDTLTLTATVSPSNATNKSVIWASTDEDVATVTNGVVTAKNAGTATIIVKTTDGSKTASCVVTVKDKEVIPTDLIFSLGEGKVGAGKTVNITLNIKNNPGISGMGFDIGYNSDVMTLVAYESNSAWYPTSNFEEDPSNNPVSFFWSKTSDYRADSTLLTLTFKIKENVPVGEYPITLKASEKIVNQNLEELSYNVVSGKISVVDYIAGDANGDALIDTKDAVLLAQYLAKWSVSVDMSSADCNADGFVDTKDAVLLAQYLAKWDVTLG